MGHPTLSIILITKNEAGCLSDCLNSVRSIADEIVVADTGSTDETKLIAKSLGAHVIDVPWHDDFAAARNEGLAYATGDWLLHMDADEVLDPIGAARIRALVNDDGSGADAVEVILANYSDDPRAWRWVAAHPGDPNARGHTGYIPVGLLRLFRNHAGYEYREPVHENITESVIERSGVIREEHDIVIHHYGYALGEKSDAKIALYLTIAERKVNERPDDAKSWRDLAEQRLVDGNQAGAEQAAREALRLDPGEVDSATTLSNLLLLQGRLDDARIILETVERRGMVIPQISAALAVIEMRQGRSVKALKRLTALIKQYPDALIARLCLARALDTAGRHDDARAHLTYLTNRFPGFEDAQKQLAAHDLRRQGEGAFQEGNATEALAAISKALKLDPDDPVMRNDLGVVFAALGELSRAVSYFESALTLAPDYAEARDNLEHVQSG